jgi:acetylglutamate kinase
MHTVVIKIGGSTVDAAGLLQELGQGIGKLMPNRFPILVHGGGKDITRLLDRLNIEFKFIEGMRVTDAEMVNVVQMALTGDVNKRIVNALLKEGVMSAGFSGIDGNLFEASKMLMRGLDIGLVGKIEKVSPMLIDMCRSNNIVPVISPISRDQAGCIYNVNADLAASELAMGIKADDLVFVSDVPGVMVDDTVVKEIRTAEIESLIERGHITGGMIPKLRSAAEAVHRGVKKVHICGWQNSATLQNQLNKGSAAGTIISQ